MIQPPRRLRGMIDRDTDALAFRSSVGDALCSFLARYGYRRVDTPILEPTELLLRKSGGELASKMYTFTDPGGHRVSLRPEFTSSVVRAYIEGLGSDALPARFSYMGSVFRYEMEESAGRRQFTQIGAEIIGANGPWVDAEVLAMACRGIARLGISGCRLVLGHLGFTGALLESLGLSDRARLFLLTNLTHLGRGSEGIEEVRGKASALGLLRDDSDGYASLSEPPNEAGIALLERYLQASPAATIGVRSPQEIRQRLLRKQTLAQDADRLEDAIQLLAQVAQVRGEPANALKQVRDVVKSKNVMETLDQLETILEALAHYGLDGEFSLDFGLGRGIAYYTGIVFEVTHPSVRETSLGGGGRYDGLVQALGGSNVTPAMGFAWTLEHVVELLASQKDARSRGSAPEMVLVRPANASDYDKAIEKAERLRSEGKVVELDVMDRSVEECVQYARSKGIGQVVTVDTDGKATITDASE